MTKKSRKKRKYLENEKSFQDEIKSIFFMIFKGLSLKQIKSKLRRKLRRQTYVVKVLVIVSR